MKLHLFATRTVKGFWDLLRQTFSQWNRDNCARLAAALAFYTLSCLAPLILFALVIAGSIFGQEAARNELLGQIDQLIGSAGVTVIQSILSNAHNSTSSFWAGLIGAIILLISAGGVFLELQGALNLIFRSPPRKDTGLK
jgi:membrane protein